MIVIKSTDGQFASVSRAFMGHRDAPEHVEVHADRNIAIARSRELLTCAVRSLLPCICEPRCGCSCAWTPTTGSPTPCDGMHERPCHKTVQYVVSLDMTPAM